MATSKRFQVGCGIAAAALLAGAWALTAATDEDPAEVASAPTTPATAPTTSEPPVEDTTTTAPAPPPPPNEEWGAINLADVTAAAGLDAPQAEGPLLGADGQVGGAAVADYDDDGDQDVFLPRVGLPNRLLRNDGEGGFTDVAAEAGVEGVDQENGYGAAVWADVEGDGDLDLYLTGAGRGGSLLLVNDGTGRFDDGTARAGLDGLAGSGLAGTASYGAAFDDWDHDGDLDLITTHWYKAHLDLQLQTVLADPETTADQLQPCTLAERRRTEPLPEGLPGSRTALLANDGTGRFTDVTAQLGVDVDRVIAFQPVFADVDDDGWNDLFLTGDFCTSRLYRNDEGRGFVDITDAAGVGTDQNGMGSVVADLDGDGVLDWFVSSIAASNPDSCLELLGCENAGNRLYLGDGDGTFTDATDRFGVRDGSWGWGAAAADLNLDGRLDLALANGVRFQAAGDEVQVGLEPGDDSADDPTRVWINTPTEPWPDAAQQIGVRDEANGKAMVAFDADGDGDLELLIANTGEAPVLYRNDLPAGAATHWLGLRLRDPGGPNPFAVGARVTVDVGDGSAPRILTVAAGGSFESSDPTDLHLGLGAADRVASVAVRWPGGETQVVRDVGADQVLTIERG
ncbi:MAG: CRTAC1 family protein [Acidimicrobiales bacterium]|nr:CRTAC1 family protein [Acidimicrobiales bacterium]